MNREQIEFIQKNHLVLSVKQIARELSLDAKDVRQEIRRAQIAGRSDRPENGILVSPKIFKKKRFHAGVTALLVIFTVLVYAKSLSYPFMNWDDPVYVTGNPDIRSFSPENIRKWFTKDYVAVYAPVTMASFAFDYRFYKFNPRGYRVTNLALHVGSVILVYFLLLLLTSDWLVSTASALIFTVHPVQPESVVWIAERKNLLGYFLMLLSFVLYVLSRRTKKPTLFYTLSFVVFSAACLSKATVVVLPLVLIVFE